MLPILITAAVSGIASGIVGIAGTKESAGFGFIGMVGPINAFKFMGIDSVWFKFIIDYHRILHCAFLRCMDFRCSSKKGIQNIYERHF